MHYIEETDSTITQLKRLKQNGYLEEYFTVSTGFQTSGKGYGKNTWESERRLNSLFSFILYPKVVSPSGQFLISKIVSLAIIDFLSNYTNDLHIKWPNDIYVGKNKIAGILIETTVKGSLIEDSIVGVGININQVEFSNNLPNPVSIKQITGKDLDTDQVIKEIVGLIKGYFKMQKTELEAVVNKKYLEYLYLFKKESKFRDSEGEFFGEICGVDEFGQLEIQTQSEKKVFGFKEVEYIKH